MRIINHNISLTYSSISTSPMSCGTPSDGFRPSWVLHRCFQAILSLLFNSFVMEAAFGVTPMMLVRREPILRYINFQLSPTQIQVLWGYSKIGMVSHPNPTISFYQIHLVIQQSYCQQGSYLPSKTFNRMLHHSKVFKSLDSCVSI